MERLPREIPAEKVAIQAPANESLLDSAHVRNAWPEEVTGSEAFAEQVATRQELIQSLDDALARISLPTTTLEEAMSQGQVSEAQAARLYLSLSRLLDDPDYQRSLLYIPFELLPRAEWQPGGQLGQDIEAFRSSYMAAWTRLLTVLDVRANFVDGDVLEVDQRTGDLPRVAKAAHLIPKLVEAGLVTLPEVLTLADQIDDPVVRASVADAIPVLADLGLIEGDEAGPAAEQAQAGPVTAETIQSEIAKALGSADALAHDGATENRRHWLRERAILQATERLADRLATAGFSSEKAATLLADDSDGTCQGVVVEAIRKAVESKSLEEAQALFRGFEDVLETIRENPRPETERLMAKALRRLYGLGAVPPDALARFSVSVPALDSPVTERLAAIAPELREIGSHIIEAAQADSRLYPVAYAYGSRLKGYGEPGSDLDTAVFVRPDTPLSAAPEISALVPGATQFWLEKHGEALAVKDIPPTGSHAGADSMTGLLFGGTPVGDPDAIRELRHKLLSPYLYETDAADGRRYWLEDMEKNVLQYRLMHKGYERSAPSYGGIDTPHADRIDGKSAFWDSGYRRLATRLYARQVFLPAIPRGEH